MLLYSNFTLSDPVLTLDLIVWSVFAGFIIAGVAALYNKRLIGNYVRELIKRGALSPETALTLAETGYAKNVFVRGALKNGSTLRKLVSCAEEDGVRAVVPPPKNKAAKVVRAVLGEPEPKIITDVDSSHFYVAERLRDRALIRYEKKGTDAFTFIATVIISLIIALLALKYVPKLLTALDDTIGLIGNTAGGSVSAVTDKSPATTTAAPETTLPPETTADTAADDGLMAQIDFRSDFF